jgi:tetratricopeptide (TPR) repeat protein
MRIDDLAGARAAVQDNFERFGDQGHSGEIWSLRLIHADLLRLGGQTEGALAYVDAKLAAFPPVADALPIQIGLRKTRGYCLGLLGKYAPSHEMLSEAESIARDDGILDLLCEVHQCRAMIFYLQKDFESSDRMFRQILAASEQLGGWYFRANALWGIGKNLMIQRFHSAAMPWLEESLALFEGAGARLSVATVWSEMAVCYLGLGDDHKSLELLEKTMEIQSAAGVTQNYLVSLANIGNVYLHRGDYLRAIDYYRQALSLARDIKDPVSIQKWSHNIRLAYTRLRDSVDGSVPGTA